MPCISSSPLHPPLPGHHSLAPPLPYFTNTESEIPTAAHVLTHPTLLIASTNVITATMKIPEQMLPFAPGLRVEQVAGGHWLQLEKPDEVNEILDSFVARLENDSID